MKAFFYAFPYLLYWYIPRERDERKAVLWKERGEEEEEEQEEEEEEKEEKEKEEKEKRRNCEVCRSE